MPVQDGEHFRCHAINEVLFFLPGQLLAIVHSGYIDGGVIMNFIRKTEACDSDEEAVGHLIGA